MGGPDCDTTDRQNGGSGMTRNPLVGLVMHKTFWNSFVLRACGDCSVRLIGHTWNS